MSIFAGIMAGSCKMITPGVATVDEFGQEIPGVDIETGPFSCYFYQPEGTIIDIISGEHQKKALQVMLPVSVTPTMNQHIQGLSTGYTETYRIISVDPAYHLDVLDHWECSLEVVI